MKNVVKLEHYYYPWELKKAIARWVEHYHHERYHESLDNMTQQMFMKADETTFWINVRW